MKANFRTSLISSAVLLAISGLTSVAYAAPTSTAAGSTVSNTASLDYKVGGTDQPQLKSCTTACTDTTGTPTTFTVDLKVNVTVTTADTTYVSALPVAFGSQPAAAKFTVTNTGNGTQDFALATKIDYANGTVNNVWGTTNVTDNLDPTACTTYLDTNNNGTYESGTDLAATYIDELAAGSSKVVFVACTFPTSSLFDQQAVIALKATAEAGGTASSEGSALTNGGSLTNYMGGGKTVSVVFADTANADTSFSDAANDGSASTLDAFHIDTSRLQITKAVAVLCDPVNGTTSPKNIPGALVRYTITITNETTGVTASRVKPAVLTNVGDLLDANLDFDAGFLGGITPSGITAGTCAGTATTAIGTKTGAAGLTTTARTPAASAAIDVSVTAVDADNLTIALTNALTAGNGHAVGELQGGETVTVVFNAAIK